MRIWHQLAWQAINDLCCLPVLTGVSGQSHRDDPYGPKFELREAEDAPSIVHSGRYVRSGLAASLSERNGCRTLALYTRGH